MVKYNGRKIVYTFKYGDYISKNDKILCIVTVVLAFIAGIGTFIWRYLDNDITQACVFLILCFIFGGIWLIMLIYGVRNNKYDNEISKWLTDEKLFETMVKPWEFDSTYERVKNYKFGIDFQNNDGESYKRISEHFDRFFITVRDKEITILYSPKYGEVMVLDCDYLKGKY